VLPAVIKELIGRLDPGSCTAFVEGLVTAEAARLGMPSANMVMSDALTENDGGLDALLRDVPVEAPQPPGSTFPAGEVGLQVKSTRRKQPSAFGLATELRKAGPKRILLTGGAYVLVSSQDLNPAQRQALEDAVREEALEVLRENGRADMAPRTSVWDAQTLAGLAAIHPGAAVDIGLDEFGQALSLPELLESLRAVERPFQSDAARDAAVLRLRERARSATSDPLLMMVHGDAGAGKTRTIAHALDTDDFRDSVLYVNGSEGLGVLIARLIRNRSSRGILFVDEVDDPEVVAASNRLGGLEGRWRLVSVRTRSDRFWIPEGGRNIVLPPLDGDATRLLVAGTSGLAEPLARTVAEVAAGFPELALRLADELRADPQLDLVRLAHLPSPAALLGRALPDERIRRHLAPIALFSSVGFDEELRYEVESVAEAFALDLDELERICESEVELGGFVSRAGRYRMVSPRLVAIWLATDLIGSIPRFDELILGLPESLRDSFVQQLEYFGPDARYLPAALTRVIGDERFRRPELFSEAAGRFLRASAAIIPVQVADAISELLADRTPEVLANIPRRDLVWTLQVLLWWPETWERAAANLYVLAQHETETWANNASSSFAGAFSLYLSGSTVPYADRAAWLSGRIMRAEPEQLRLLVEAVAAGLQEHHVRTVVGFRGGGEPRDWQPQSLDEYRDARRAAWRLLLAARDRTGPDDRAAVTKQIAQSLRIAYDSTLGGEVDADIRARTWSPVERAELASGLRDVIKYEELDAAVLEGCQVLHDHLVGQDLRDRLLIVLGTAIWDLHTERETANEAPPLLVELAIALAAQGSDGLGLALDIGRDFEQQDTRYALFRLLAERLGADLVGDSALSREDWPAVSAALSVADGSGQGAWATRVLSELAKGHPERVPELLSFVALQPERLDMALSLIDNGKSSGVALGRLLYGARIKALDETYAIRVLEAVSTSGNTEAAVGLLDQWLDEHAERSEPIQRIAGKLALEAVAAEGSTMLEFYVARLVKANALAHDDLLRVFEARMMGRIGRVDELDTVLTERVLADAESAWTSILELVRRPSAFGLFAAGDLALLTRLAAATSAERVWAELESWPEPELRWALHHMNWKGTRPEPLVRAFLMSERLQEFESEAAVCFSNTLGVVRGPYYLALEREVERARGWRDALTGTGGEQWADRLIAHKEIEVERYRRRDIEEDVRLR
jgi:hypothetical protein